MIPFRYASALTLLAFALAGTPEPATAQTTHRGHSPAYVGIYNAEPGASTAVPAATRRGGPGSLDITFGTDGAVVFPAPEVSGVAFQSDGKILTGGRIAGDAAVFRLNPDGSFDESFGTEGIATVDLGGTLDIFLSVAVQDDGKIVAAGSIFLNPNGDGDGAALARFLPDGTLDMGFGTDGLVLEPGTPDSGTPDAFWHVAVRPSGEIIAGGPQGIFLVTVEANECYAAQYLPDGSRDASFGTDGLVSAVPDEDAFCLDGHLMDDGRYVLGVNVEPEPFMSRWGAVRLLPGGSHDATFGDGGLTLVPDAVNQFYDAVTVGPDGATTHGAFLPGPDAPALVRFTADGALDVSFGTDGFSVLAGIGPGTLHDIQLQPDRKILMSGRRSLASGGIIPFLARAEPDGSLDAGFGTDGEGFTNIALTSSSSSNGYGWNLGLDGENRIVVTGNVDYNASPVEGFVARFENDVSVATEPPADGHRLTLRPPSPNPALGRATLTFTLAEATPVHLAVYDALGRAAEVLLEGTRAAGAHEVAFDASHLAPGLYVVRLTAGSERATRRLVVVR